MAPLNDLPVLPDMTPMDFYFWVVVRDNVFARRPHNLYELEAYIYDAFQNIENDKTVQKRVLEECIQGSDDCINCTEAIFRPCEETFGPPCT